MRTKFFFLIAMCFLFAFANHLSAQTAANFSNPGVEYKRAPNTLKLKKKDKVMRNYKFDSRRKSNGNRHPYISKKKKVQKQTMSLNKKHRNKDRGNKAPRTW